MSLFPVRPEKAQALLDKMVFLGIRDKDLEESFVRAGGRGGQKLNKTSSCVYLKHLPTGIEVKCEKERSRALNRYHARVILCKKIELREKGGESEEARRMEKIRKQKNRRARRSRSGAPEIKP